MAIHQIKVHIRDSSLREGLEEILTEQINDEFGVDVENIKGVQKSIKADAKALYPQYVKAILRELTAGVDEGIMDAVDNLGTWRGGWKPLDRIVDKYSRDTVLAEQIEEQEREYRVKRLRESAEELGFDLVELDD